MQNPPGRAYAIANYKRKAESKLLLDTAARFWARGVPWDEALNTARTVRQRVQQRLRTGMAVRCDLSKGESLLALFVVYFV